MHLVAYPPWPTREGSNTSGNYASNCTYKHVKLSFLLSKSGMLQPQVWFMIVFVSIYTVFLVKSLRLLNSCVPSNWSELSSTAVQSISFHWLFRMLNSCSAVLLTWVFAQNTWHEALHRVIKISLPSLWDEGRHLTKYLMGKPQVDHRCHQMYSCSQNYL